MSQRRPKSSSARPPKQEPLPYPHPTSAAVTAVMKGVRRANTKPELAIRSLLHRRGLRFRKDALIVAEGVRARPDIVFPRRQVAVFVDGCFWHCCPQHGNTPRANTAYWEPKLTRNVRRDREVTEGLRSAGWTVIRVWEHEPPTTAAEKIAAQLERGADPTVSSKQRRSGDATSLGQ